MRYEVITRAITCTACTGTDPTDDPTKPDVMGPVETRRNWNEGSIVDLSPEDARSLLNLGAVKALKELEPPPAAKQQSPFLRTPADANPKSAFEPTDELADEPAEPHARGRHAKKS